MTFDTTGIQDQIINGKRVLQFIAREDGTALDSITGLTWFRFLLGQEWQKRRALGDPQEMSYQEVLQKIDTFNDAKFGGFFDWRLPKQDEIKRISGEDKTIIGNDNSLLGSNEVILFESSKNSDRFWTAGLIGKNAEISALANYYGGKVARANVSMKFTRLVRG